MVQCTDLFGDVRLSQPQLAGCQKRLTPHSLRGSESAEPPLPLADTLDRTGVAPENICHFNTPIIPTGPVKSLGKPKPDLPLNQRLPDFFAADSIRPILPSSLASACLRDKAEPPVFPRRSKSVTGKTLSEHGPLKEPRIRQNIAY